MGLKDWFLNNALDSVESAIDTEPERAEVKKDIDALIDWLDKERDLPGPDYLTVQVLKMIAHAGVDSLAAALDDGEE